MRAVSFRRLGSSSAVVASLVWAMLVLGSGVPHAAHAQSGARSGQWAHEVSRLTPDPSVHWGRLDNGLRFALLPHHGVPGRVTVRLIVLAGSIDERPSELGMAHFVEHLAFRGTERFPKKAMTALFEQLGIEWGADVNAVTSFDYTAYSLDFRENDPELIDDGLKLLRGFAGDVKFEPEAIERERRVILAELRARDGLGMRQQMAAFPLIFRGLRFPERSPGGTPERILAFERDDFVAFYQRLYRPDLMVVVATGDFDPAAMAERVRTLFGDLRRPAAPIPPRDEGRFNPGAGVRTDVYRTSLPGRADVLMASVVPASGRTDTREAHIERQRRQFIGELLDLRLRTAPGVMQGGGSYQTVMGHEALLATAAGPANDWQSTVSALDQAMQQLLRRGFDADEIDSLRRRKMRMATHLLEQAGRVDSMVLAEELTDSIVNHTVYIEPVRRLTWMQEWLRTTNSRELQNSLRALWRPDNLAVHLSGDLALEVRAADVARRVQQMRRGGPGSFLLQEEQAVEFALPNWGTPGRVAERTEVAELDTILLRWQNGVRTNLALRPGEPRIVRAVVRVAGGLRTLPEGRAALKEFGLNTVMAGGTTHYNAEQLGFIIRDRLLQFSFDVDDHDAFTFRGTMASENLDVFFGIVAGFLHRPRFSTYVHQTERMRAGMARSAGAIGLQQGQREWTDHLFRGDARFVWATPMDYMGLGVNDVRAWMEEPLSRGYVEATIVGDISEGNALSVLARTLGTLGPRAAEPPPAASSRPVRVTMPAGTARLEFVGENHLAMALGAWPVEAELSVRDEAALHLLARILEGRMRETIREEKGLAYSPTAQFNAYRGFPGFALIEAQVDCAPSEADRTAALVREVAGRLTETGVREGEFAGAQGVLRTRMRLAFEDNGFLLGLIQRAQQNPQSMADALALAQGVVAQVQREEVEEWARRVLPVSNGRTAAVAPKQLIGILDVRSP